jgi:RNA polymerase sigma-70 factor (sigma-E family)
MVAATIRGRATVAEGVAVADEEHVDVLAVGAAGGADEFERFMVEASPALARTAWLLCGDARQAEELVQQTLIRTYLAWPRARQRDPLAYARRTLANLRIDTWRARRREVLTAPSSLPEAAVASGAERYAERDQLVRALATLSPRARRIVVLRHLEGMSEREVADDLGVSLGTVKSTASRALAQLRATLGDPPEGRP